MLLLSAFWIVSSTDTVYSFSANTRITKEMHLRLQLMWVRSPCKEVKLSSFDAAPRCVVAVDSWRGFNILQQQLLGWPAEQMIAGCPGGSAPGHLWRNYYLISRRPAVCQESKKKKKKKLPVASIWSQSRQNLHSREILFLYVGDFISTREVKSGFTGWFECILIEKVHTFISSSIAWNGEINLDGVQ